MPAIANKSLFVQSDPVLSGLDEMFRVVLIATALSLSARIGHVWPNLAAIVGTVRKVHNVSQTELGRNRHVKTNQIIFPGLSVPSDLHRNDTKHRKAGYFSLIANIEQGGRKTAIPADFVAYLAGVSGLSVSTIEGAIAEDAALSTAMAQNNPVVPENTVTVEKTVKAQSPKK